MIIMQVQQAASHHHAQGVIIGFIHILRVMHACMPLGKVNCSFNTRPAFVDLHNYHAYEVGTTRLWPGTVDDDLM